MLLVSILTKDEYELEVIFGAVDMRGCYVY